MADISLTSYNHIGISINPTLNIRFPLTSNIHITSNIDNELFVGVLTILEGSSNINSETFGTISYGYSEQLSSICSIINTATANLIFGDDEFISDSIQITSNINADLICQIKCDNCKFNNIKGITKYTPRCYRTAKFQNKKNNCNMYIYV